MKAQENNTIRSHAQHQYNEDSSTFKSFNAFIASQDATYQETTEVNMFETHVIPDLKDEEEKMCHTYKNEEHVRPFA